MKLLSKIQMWKQTKNKIKKKPEQAKFLVCFIWRKNNFLSLPLLKEPFGKNKSCFRPAFRELVSSQRKKSTFCPWEKGLGHWDLMSIIKNFFLSDKKRTGNIYVKFLHHFIDWLDFLLKCLRFSLYVVNLH